MSISLPKEVQTQKVKTLPDDLKAIAEEMLGEKFGEEVVEVKPQGPFPNKGRAYQDTADASGCGNSFCATCYDGLDPCGLQMGREFRGGPGFGGATTRGIATADVSLESCYEIKRGLERDYGPFIKRGSIEWQMGRRQFDDLIRDRRSDAAIQFGVTPRLFGIPVRLQGEDTHLIRLVAYY